MGRPGLGEGEDGFQVIPLDAIKFFDRGAQAKVPDREDVGAF